MPNLYPTFDVPAITLENTTLNKQKVSIYFDFEKGDYCLDNSGKIISATPYEAWCQWCLKTVYTQRWAFLGYSDQIGIEMEEAFNQPSNKATESILIRTITEALLADPYERTKRVYDFHFNWHVDGLNVTFTVNGAWGEDATLTAKFKKGGAISGY